MRWAAVAVLVLGLAATAYCQAPKADKKPNAADEGPKFENLVLRTGDGLLLAVTYYPGDKGKQTIPIVLLHGLSQSRGEYKDLAPALQRLGYAVVAPDLRGHGESTHKRGASKDDKLDAAKMAPAQFGLMVREDMRAVKDFLWERNNAGQLNIDKLCVVGADMGASVALDFAAYDAVGYQNGTVYYGPLKLGRFVKALVLISPKWSSPGLPLAQAARNPVVQRDIAMLILVGKEDVKAMDAAKRVYGLFKNSHLEPTGDDKLDRQTLFFGSLPTSLQGTKLLDPRFNVQGLIADFVYRRLVKSEESQEWTWKDRKFPHE
jgi:pimeloyl-ACP methyl ester carboxylesterase